MAPAARLHRLDRQHPVLRPVVPRKSLAYDLVRRSAYSVEDLSLAGNRSAKDYEAFFDQRVHETRMLVPAVLLA
jgi:hypothetical protein